MSKGPYVSPSTGARKLGNSSSSTRSPNVSNVFSRMIKPFNSDSSFNQQHHRLKRYSSDDDLDDNKYVPREVSEHFKRYELMTEFINLRNSNHCPLGLYIMPSSENFNVWYGVLFVHKGYYSSGVFKFRLVISESYPEYPPSVTFMSDMFHPLIDGGGNLAICQQFLAWKPDESYIIHVLHYIKNIFKRAILDRLVDKICLSKEAYRLYRTDRKTFIKLARQCADLTITESYLFDHFPDDNLIKLSPMNEMKFANIRSQILPPQLHASLKDETAISEEEVEAEEKREKLAIEALYEKLLDQARKESRLEEEQENQEEAKATLLEKQEQEQVMVTDNNLKINKKEIEENSLASEMADTSGAIENEEPSKLVLDEHDKNEDELEKENKSKEELGIDEIKPKEHIEKQMASAEIKGTDIYQEFDSNQANQEDTKQEAVIQEDIQQEEFKQECTNKENIEKQDLEQHDIEYEDKKKEDFMQADTDHENAMQQSPKKEAEIKKDIEKKYIVEDLNTNQEDSKNTDTIQGDISQDDNKQGDINLKTVNNEAVIPIEHEEIGAKKPLLDEITGQTQRDGTKQDDVNRGAFKQEKSIDESYLKRSDTEIEELVPEETAPEEVAPKEVAPKEIISEEIKSEEMKGETSLQEDFNQGQVETEDMHHDELKHEELKHERYLVENKKEEEKKKESSEELDITSNNGCGDTIDIQIHSVNEDESGFKEEESNLQPKDAIFDTNDYMSSVLDSQQSDQADDNSNSNTNSIRQTDTDNTYANAKHQNQNDSITLQQEADAVAISQPQ